MMVPFLMEPSFLMDHDEEEVQRVGTKERREDAGRRLAAGEHRRTRDARKAVHRGNKAALLGQHRADHDHEAHEHDDALDEVVHGRRHVAARDHVDRREDRHEDDAPGVVDGERHPEKAREAVVERRRVGDEEDEDDDRRHDLQGRAPEALGEEVGHRGGIEVLRHDARAASQHGPREERADERVADAGPGRGNAVPPAELAGVAHEHHGGEVGGPVRERREPGAD